MIPRLLTLLLAATCAMAQEGGAKLSPITWSVTGPKEAKAGARLKIKVTAHIADGWHLYSLKKQEDGPIPTSIEVPPPQDFRLDGIIDAPAPLTQRDELFGIDVEYYLGEMDFSLPVVVGREAKAGPRKLAVTARFQACDNKICLPPRTVRLEHSVLLK
jgi:DsbC/DsbD-like thiol-disulfide interchange protein